MNLVQVKLLSNPSSMLHNTSGHIRLSGVHTPKNYTFLNLVGAKPNDYVMVSVTNTITYGKVISIDREATPEDVISEWLKPIICVISNRKIADYYRLRHLYRNNITKQGKLVSKPGYSPLAYMEALAEISPVSRNLNQKWLSRLSEGPALLKERLEGGSNLTFIIDSLSGIHRRLMEQTIEAEKQAEQERIAKEQERLDREQLERLEALLLETKKSIKELYHRGIKFKNI